MSDSPSFGTLVNAPIEQILTLEEARKILLQTINKKLEKFLQERNYPVDFDSIKLPTINPGDLEENKEKNTVSLTEKAKKRIVTQIRKDLEETYTARKIQEKKEALEAKLVALNEELKQIPNQLSALAKFLCHGNATSIAKKDRDINEFQARQQKIPFEIEQIKEALQFFIHIRPYPDDTREQIVNTTSSLLEETLGFQEPEKEKKKTRMSPNSESGTTSSDMLPTVPDNQTRGVGLKTAAMAAFIMLGVAWSGGELWKNHGANKKATAEEMAHKNSSLLQHPEIVAWLGEEVAHNLTISEIEETAEKIRLVQKYAHLQKKYAGEKIKKITTLELYLEVPGEIMNNPILHQKIRDAWSKMCKNKAGTLLDIYFQTGGKCETEMKQIFEEFFPDVVKIPAHFIKIQGIVAPTDRISDSPNAQEDFGIQLQVKTDKDGTFILAQGVIGNMSEYFHRMTQETVDRIQIDLFKKIEDSNGIHWANILELTKFIQEALEHVSAENNLTSPSFTVVENRTDMITGTISTTVEYNGPGYQRKLGVLQFHTLRTNNHDLEYIFGNAVKIIEAEIGARNGVFAILDNWGAYADEKTEGPEKMRICSNKICELLSLHGVMEAGTKLEFLGSATQHDGEEIIGMMGHFRFVVNGKAAGEFILPFDLRKK